MKTLHKKRIDIGILAILLFLSLAIFYYATMQYSRYLDLSKSRADLSVLEDLNGFLEHIDEERRLSSLFILKSSDDTVASNLNSIRQLVDKDLDKLQKNDGGALSKGFFDKFSTLNAVRNKISKREISFDELFAQRYTKDFSFTVINEINTIIKSLEIQHNNGGFYNSMKAFNLDKYIALKDIQSNREILDLYLELILIEENIEMERGFISFLLYKDTPFSDKNLVTWNSQINKDYIPKIGKLTDNNIVAKLDILLDQDLYFASIDEQRSDIVLSSINDRLSTINKDKWNNTAKQRVEKITKSINILSLNIKNTVLENISQIKKELYILGTILILLLLIILALYFRFRSSTKDEHGFKEAIEDIRLNLNPSQQNELNDIIKKQNKVKIYNFMADTIAESNRSKDLFLANMSHEIRTPLNGILGFTQLLKSTKLTGEQLEFIKIIDNSSSNLLVIVNDILDLAKIQEQKVELESIEFNPFDIFESAIESYGAKADEKNINLQLFVDPHINTTLKGDPTKLTQVVVNLISNAIKFTPEEGVIDVRVEKISSQDGYSNIRFAVKDTGIGVSEEQKKSIFKAFSQEDISTSRQYGGTGLGLTISKKFIDAMGGELDIDSIKGEGSTFFFELHLPEVSPIDVNQNNHHIGFCMPHNQKQINERENIKKYIEYTGAKYSEYLSIDSLLESNHMEHLTLLFVHSIDMEELGKIPQSDMKIIHISKLDNFRDNNHQFPRIDSVIYKPINFSKIKRGIDISKNSNNLLISSKDSSQSLAFDNLSILIAEDNKINQKLMEHTLSNLKIQLTIVENGKEALEQRKSNHYDLILMDIQMPVMDGVEATHKILEYEEQNNLPHTPIVALTANNIKGDRERLMSEGMDEFLPKPIELKKIESMLKEYFPQKVSASESRIDIILCKNQKTDNKIFKALFESMGYSVHTADDFNDYREKIESTNYNYSFADTFLFNEEPMLKNILQTKNIKNVIFVNKFEDSKTMKSLHDYDNIIPGIAEKSLIEYYMQKI
ncbi:MAG: ATP-binding protein [Campylobacterota bacterium]|nr:ATP-binding protein [Campylobacterota bacterium]